MRTLQTLRESCIDTDDNNDFIVYESVQFVAYMDIKAFKLANQLSSGFYYLSGMIVFNYDKTNFTFPPSKVQNKITMTYSEPMVGGTSNQVVSVIDVSNSYLPIDANNIAIVIERPIYIKPNSGGFKLSFTAVEFDGTEEPVATTGGGSAGFSQSFNLVEWDDSFFWNDTTIHNTYPGTGDIEYYIQQTKLCDFTIDVGKDGSNFTALAQFTAWLPNGFPNDSIPAGIFKSATIETCHLIVKNSQGVEISRNSTSGSYRTFLEISVMLDAGTYGLYASGAGHTTISAAIEQHGYTPLLVSRTKTGTKDPLNTDSGLAVATLRVPVFTEINIDGTTTESSTYLAQSVPAGVANLPLVNFDGHKSHLNMRKIF